MAKKHTAQYIHISYLLTKETIPLTTHHDNELIHRIANGDEKAEAELFSKYNSKIDEIVSIRLKVGTKEDEKDLASEVKLALLDILRQGSFKTDGTAKLSTFISTLARNKITHHLAKKRPMLTNTDFDALPSGLQEIARRDKQTEQLLYKLIRSVIQTMDQKYRITYELALLEHMKIADIASVLELSPKEVSYRLQYAKRLIKKELQKRKIFPDSFFS